MTEDNLNLPPPFKAAVTPAATELFSNAQFRIELRSPVPEGWQGDPAGYYVVVNNQTGLLELQSPQLAACYQYAANGEAVIAQVRQLQSGLVRVRPEVGNIKLA